MLKSIESSNMVLKVLVGNVEWAYGTSGTGIHESFDVLLRVDGKLVGLKFFIQNYPSIGHWRNDYQDVLVQELDQERTLHLAGWLEASRNLCLLNQCERQQLGALHEKWRKEKKEIEQKQKDHNRELRKIRYEELKAEFDNET